MSGNESSVHRKAALYIRWNMKKEIIGRSRLGREIPLFRSERGDAVVLLVGGIHAREYVTCEVVKALAEYAGVVDCVPCLDPDGRAIVEGADRPRIPFTGDVRQWKANAYGVDLNVNFDAGWGTGERNVTVPGSANYIGKYPESEPETRAICDLIRRKRYPLVLSYHTLGEEVYWGFGHNYAFREEAERYASSVGYPLKKSIGSAGGLKDWYCLHFSGLALTVEAGKSEWGHPCPLWRKDEIISRHLPSMEVVKRIGEEIVRKNDERGASAGKDSL